jgi:ABC-type antimicrobial peptide transport system permease subunit
MIVWRGLTLALIGVGTGLGIAVVVTRLISKMLYGIQSTDPLTFAATAGLFLLVSIAASSVPAYRAARMDPMKTLREQ